MDRENPLTVVASGDGLDVREAAAINQSGNEQAFRAANDLRDRGTETMIAKDVKNGTLIVHQGDPCMIRSISVQSPSARGAATLYKFRATNLRTKQKVDVTFKGAENVEEADFERRDVQLMYLDSDHAHFLDQADYNQYQLPLKDVEEELKYVTENLEGVQAMIHNEECIGIRLPLTVELKVAQCDPAVRGNSATSRTKPATLETGLVIQAPEYLAEGETVKVDTQTGKFLSRA